MRFQKSDASWIVWVSRREFPGAKRHWPSEFVIGSISKARGIDVWPAPYGTQERGGKEPARWHATAERILSSPQMRARVLGAMKGWRREEKATGRFVVKLSDGRKSSFHAGPQAQAWLLKKLDKMPNGSTAGIFHDRGLYATQPFSVLKKNEYGHIVHTALSDFGNRTRTRRTRTR